MVREMLVISMTALMRYSFFGVLVVSMFRPSVVVARARMLWSALARRNTIQVSIV